MIARRWNVFDLDAEELSEIYRSRWQIELFFKWMKQPVKIKKFYGTSENAVRNQIFLAMITYCLTLLVKLQGNDTLSCDGDAEVVADFCWQPSSPRDVEHADFEEQG